MSEYTKELERIEDELVSQSERQETDGIHSRRSPMGTHFWHAG